MKPKENPSNTKYEKEIIKFVHCRLHEN